MPLLLSGCAVQGPPGSRAQFADVAQKLRAFPPDRKFFVSQSLLGSASVVDCTPMDLKMEFANGWPITPGTTQYERLMRTNYPVPFLLSLLKDPDPKIRTLAAAALVAKGDPRLQRHLGPLLVDQTPTFDVITTLPTDNYRPPHYTPQTVAMAVLQLVEKRTKEFFDRYWDIHATREYSGDWFLWQFRHQEFASVARQGIPTIPSPDRELIALWIGSGRSDFQNERYSGYTDVELLAAAKHLGRENVLSVLRNRPPTADPDVLQNSSPGTYSFQHYSEMGHFLLAHAKELLESSDADALLDLETAERARKNSQEPVYREWWPIAAANLRPKEADAILDAAAERWPEAGNVSLALWDIRGSAALPRILQRFYSSPAAQNSLAYAIYMAKPNDSYQALVAAILASDGRLKIYGEPMFTFAELKQEWKAGFDASFVDWIFAQSPDLDRGWGARRELVVRTSGVARKLVLDPRFSKADAQLLYAIEQSLVGSLKLTKAQSTRLDQLMREIDFGNRKNPSASSLQEIGNFLRLGVGGS